MFVQKWNMFDIDLYCVLGIQFPHRYVAAYDFPNSLLSTYTHNEVYAARSSISF